MKKTPLKRKTPLKAKTGLKSTGGFKSIPAIKSTSGAPVQKPSSTLKNKNTVSVRSKSGMKGAGRSDAHKQYHERVISLGCFACNYLGITPSSRLCIHHIDGRNTGKENDYSEWLVVCLCHEHHDPSSLCGASTKGLSVHHNKRLFVQLIGSEKWCVMETFRELDIMPPWLAQEQWGQYLCLTEKDIQENWIVIGG